MTSKSITDTHVFSDSKIQNKPTNAYKCSMHSSGGLRHVYENIWWVGECMSVPKWGIPVAGALLGPQKIHKADVGVEKIKDK